MTHVGALGVPVSCESRVDAMHPGRRCVLLVVAVHPALERSYDFIICGSGSSGSVVAGRIAENPDVRVLLLEAGGNADLANVVEADMWPTNLESERVWDFRSEPNACLNGRVFHMSMGKVLGGGSSVNLMAWARGHKSDWNLFA